MQKTIFTNLISRMRKRRALFSGIIIVFISFILNNCASLLPEPDSSNQTLVVGMVNVQYQTHTITKGVNFSLESEKGIRVYGLSSGADGLFYSTHIPPGRYKITRIRFTRPEGGDQGLNWNTSTPTIEIVQGRVNNLGIIKAVLPANATYWTHYENQGYEQAINLFRSRYPSSNWNQKELIYIGFNRTNITASGSAALAQLTPLTGTVSITGTSQVGQTLTADTSNLGGTGVINYQWMRGTAKIGTDPTYVLTEADSGSTVYVTVTRSNSTGSFTSSSTAIVTSATTSPANQAAIAAQPTPAPASPSVAQTSPPQAQPNIPAPAKHAMIIGNGNYTGISRLNNPVNDANDMEAALRNLGFTVDKVLDGNLDRMETAIMNFVRRLGASRNAYGFFFYAGHGVQFNGENYLIPVDANSILSENHLRQRAVSVQTILENMNSAGNELNMIVLDACRDNPFSWARSGSRGLSVVSGAPTGSIVMFATGASQTASDGTGRNGLFTNHLLNNLKTPGLSVFEVFDRTMGEVSRATNGRQHPELSLRFSGAASAYLGNRP